MVEVKIMLFDAVEISLLAQLEQALAMKRAQQAGMQVGVSNPPEPTLREVVIEAAEQAGVVEPETLVGDVPPYADDVAVQRAITEYAQREGVPAAKDLLKSFGAQRVMDVPLTRRNEFVAATQPKVTA